MTGSTGGRRTSPSGGLIVSLLGVAAGLDCAGGGRMGSEHLCMDGAAVGHGWAITVNCKGGHLEIR